MILTLEQQVCGLESAKRLKELWRPIKGYEALYEISTSGEVRRLAGLISKTNHHNQREIRWKGRILKQTKSPFGYCRITLCKNGIKKWFSVHRLVAINFIDNTYLKPSVNHIDGNPANNKLENLEWATISENSIHSFSVLKNKNGMQPGENHKMAKLKEVEVKEIRRIYKKGNITQKELAAKYGVTHQTISDIINYKRWK